MHLILTAWPVPAAKPAGVSPPALHGKQQKRQKPNRNIYRPVCPKAAELAVTMDEVEIMVPNRADIMPMPELGKRYELPTSRCGLIYWTLSP